MMNNLLQISDFFQCKASLAFCVAHMPITKESAALNIREALKKI
jgi:hypothetical protein